MRRKKKGPAAAATAGTGQKQTRHRNPITEGSFQQTPAKAQAVSPTAEAGSDHRFLSLLRKAEARAFKEGNELRAACFGHGIMKLEARMEGATI